MTAGGLSPRARHDSARLVLTGPEDEVRSTPAPLMLAAQDVGAR